MAELLLKVGTVGPDPAYQDGDIIDAITDRRISHVNLSHLCHVKSHGVTKDGRRIAGTIAQRFHEATYRYRFNRLSSETILRTDLLKGGSEELGPTPNARGERIDVPRFIASQLKHPGHRIFGTPGSEVWYGGQINLSDAVLDAFWPDVEYELKVRRDDFRLFPWGRQDVKSHLVLKVDSFDDDQANIYRAPTWKNEEGGELSKIRAHSVAWKSLDLGVSQADIENKEIPVDTRADKSFLCASVVTAKSFQAAPK